MLEQMTTGDADQLPPDLRAWIEQTVGGQITSCQKLDRWRPNYSITVTMTDASVIELVLKCPRAPKLIQDRSQLLLQFGTQRESLVLQQLQGTDVPVPRYFGYHAEHGALLISRVDGTGVIDAAAPAHRKTLMVEYGAQLARTHALTDLSIVRDGFAQAWPTTDQLSSGPLNAVFADYDALRHRLPQPDPLIDLAFWWILQHRPADVEPVLLHGDAGANQFMFIGDRLVAILDWELGHLGDPMSDLGYARFREALYPSGAYPEFVEAYTVSSGRTIDTAAVDYFTVAAAIVMLAGVASDAQRPRARARARARARNSEALQRFWWDTLARKAICQVFGESRGLVPEAYEAPTEHYGELTSLATLLNARLGLETTEASHLAGGMAHTRQLAETLERAVAMQPDIAELGGTTELLGTRISDPIARHSAVSEMVATQAEERFDDLTRYFTHQAERRVALMAPLASTDSWGDELEPSDLSGHADPVLPPYTR